MAFFKVWAPRAQNVRVKIENSLFNLNAKDHGWWEAEIRKAKAGDDYAYILDERDKPLPDPRSAYQPYGVHGTSRLVDHNAFPWTDSGFQPQPFSSAVIYECHVGTFTPEGTFEAMIPKLDYLRDLGITHVELMPVNEFPGSRGWGYDGVDLYAPHHSYGGPDGLKKLVNACHEKGLAVLLDVVYNHLGPDGNYLDQFGPYFTDRHHTPWGRAVNFDTPGSDVARRFFIDNALMWLRDYHFDGLRLDAIHAIVDTSATHILEELANEVEALEGYVGRHKVLIAESNLNDPRVIQPSGFGGYGNHAQWTDDVHHALHTVLTGESQGYYIDFGSFADLAKALKNAYVYDGQYSKFRRRNLGKPPHHLSGHKFVTFLQNHDQVGNRAQGERLHGIAGIERLKIGAALLFTSPFVTLIFQGEEWAASTPFLYFTDHQNPDLGKAVLEGRRREFADFGWDPKSIPDPQDEKTFQRSVLKWQECETEPHQSVLQWYKKLIQLRKQFPQLTDGHRQDVLVDYDEEKKWINVQRRNISTACNLSDDQQVIPLPLPEKPVVLLKSANEISIHDKGVTLPPQSVAIFWQ